MNDLGRAYLEASDGDARDALRRALGYALIEMAEISGQVSRGFVRAQRPADLAKKLGRDRRAWEASR
ncbi:hypothetical protein [Methylobacterium sp. 37f]|uniref:hypothetical protein n=1 Tax=Methylobacterium sp. 37f TaxID=2817058 RepID=UPI001FFD65AF